MTTTLARLDAVTAGIADVVGGANVRPATAADAVAGVKPSLVVEPGTAEDLAKVLRLAADAGLAVVPRGGGTKLAWGNPARAGDLVLSTRRLGRVEEHASGDLTVTVQAGCTVARLQEVVAGGGQRLALDPAWAERATVGGVIATNDSGALRGAFGSVRDQLLGIRVALSDGRLPRAGGRVVKNVAGYDLGKLYTGSLGTLGVVVEATFRLYPVPRETRTLRFACPGASAAAERLLAINASTLRPTGVQLLAGSGASELAVRLESATPKALQEQQAQLLALMAPLQAVESEDAWLERERLSSGGETAAVCKLTFLPGHLAALLDVIAVAGASWRVVAQGHGIGWLRLEATSLDALRAAILGVRAEAERRGGALVVAEAPAEVCARLDSWGDPGDALPLMRRVKAQLDPRGVLNAGRFVGGI